MNFPKISFAATCLLLGTSSPVASDSSGKDFKLFRIRCSMFKSALALNLQIQMVGMPLLEH